MSYQERLQYANQLRLQGNLSAAIQIYVQLDSQFPMQGEIIFNKALCFTDTDSGYALSLYEQVLNINPNVDVVYGNMVTIAIKTGDASKVLDILERILNKNKDNLDAIYYRAVLIGNEGNYLKALLDFYFVLENSNLGSDANFFKEHQISTDIAYCKTQLRNQTIRLRINDDLNKYFPGIKFKEYQYSLPMQLFGDENFLLDFGKMMGFTLQEVIKQEPDYISWCILNLDNFCVSEEIIMLLERANVKFQYVLRLIQ